MKKYLYIYKTTLIEDMQYILNILLGFISFFITMFIFLNLWNYMYSDGTQLINGYNVEQMIWYVLITETLWYGTRNKTLTDQVSKDIKDGNIAYNINKPYSYVTYVIVKHLGEITIKSIIYGIVGVAIGLIFIGPISNFNLINIPGMLIAIILGILINSILRIVISVLSFWIEDATPLHWIYDKMILILGTLFPIEVFPTFLQPIMKFTPIYCITYGPAKLIIDFNIQTFITVIIAQVIYVAISILILALLYRKGVSKLNVNGG